MFIKILKPLSFLPAILLMYIIFSFSGQEGSVSSQLSYRVSYQLVETGAKILNRDMDVWQIDEVAVRINGYVRKLAHMGEYFALAVAVAFPLYVYGLRGIWLILVAGAICVGFACTDEYHQSFVEGRTPSGRDVAIDSFGIFWGIILVRIVGWTGRMTIFRPFTKKKKKQQEAEYQYQYYQQDPMPPVQEPRQYNSDSLSEDMSLKKLMHNLRGSKKT